MSKRKQDRGLISLRRSTDLQETSLETQIRWGITNAERLGVRVDASVEDLAYMRAHGLYRYKDIRLDDSITGADLERPGLTSLLEDAVADKRISHVFVFKRDRLARPDNPIPMMEKEWRLINAGITLVFSDGIAEPPPPGQTDLSHIVQMLFGYHESGQFLRSLSERVIAAQMLIAEQGYCTGGDPPYGFGRVLVGPDGEIIEELPAGRRVRQPGCHVRHRPKDLDKIAIWVYILDLKHSGWGFKRIAARLNAMGVPSPGAGKTRTDHGVRHRVTGKWHHNTIADLCRNRAILGLRDYGRRSMGHHRRLGAGTPRPLSDDDRLENGRPRVIHNPPEVVVSAASGNAAQYDLAKWQEMKVEMDRRGQNQRGVPRAKDPAKYPLAGQVVDLTDGCGAVLHGMTVGERRVYKCGRYVNSTGALCEHNVVDAEALLRFTLGLLRQSVDRNGQRERVRELLRERAAQEVAHPRRSLLDSANQRVESLRADLVVCERRMATERDDARYNALAGQFDAIRAELASAEREMESHRSTDADDRRTDPEYQVAKAMALLDEIHAVTEPDAARERIRPLLTRIGARIGLSFTGALKGRRQVRRLRGGILVFGAGPLPVQLHGTNNAEEPDTTATPTTGAAVANNETRGMVPRNATGEGVSLSMVSRGDRTSFELFLGPFSAWNPALWQLAASCNS